MLKMKRIKPSFDLYLIQSEQFNKIQLWIQSQALHLPAA